MHTHTHMLTLIYNCGKFLLDLFLVFSEFFKMMKTKFTLTVPHDFESLTTTQIGGTCNDTVLTLK